MHLQARRDLTVRWAGGERAFAAGEKSVLPDLGAAFQAYAALCKDHFWKESDILYPAAERMLASEDAREGPRAFAEKRKPVWQGR